MKFSVKEFRSDPLSKLSSIGVSPKFKENPAFSSALAEIDSLISKMNIDDASDNIEVTATDTKLSFTCRDADNKIYAFGISVFEPTDFRCVFVEEEDVIHEDRKCHQRTVIEKNILLEENNYITITTLGATLDNKYPEANKCNNVNWSESERYSSTGIMLKKENITYKPTIINEDFMKTSINSMLYILHKSLLSPDEHTRELARQRMILCRDYLDTASIFIEDKDMNSRFSAKVPLNQEQGLRDMEIDEVYKKCPKEVFIPPAEKWEIDLMITSESNPTVQEGLKNLSVGRDTFSYDSTKDPRFERQGFIDSYGTK